MDQINNILEKININGGNYWSRLDGDIYHPNSFSTIVVLNVLSDLGLDKNHKIIQNCIEYIKQLYDNKTKEFRFSPKNSKLPCVNAKIINTLFRLGVKEDFLHEATERFYSTQQKDGGWRCSVVKLGKSPETDASNPGTTLFVLDLLKDKIISDSQHEKTDQAVDFLLQHWVTRKPLGPCEFGIGTIFQRTEYPFYRYNIFYYVYVLSFYKKAILDQRFLDAYDVLIAKERDERIVIENPHKSWDGILYQDNQFCDLADFKYKELKNNVGLTDKTI